MDKNEILKRANDYISADEFYNSLKNGTESGTFSVDKLGDAMKEFGIRTKDTATTTDEGFELLVDRLDAGIPEAERLPGVGEPRVLR